MAGSHHREYGQYAINKPVYSFFLVAPRFVFAQPSLRVDASFKQRDVVDDALLVPDTARSLNPAALACRLDAPLKIHAASNSPPTSGFRGHGIGCGCWY